jgi:hypothetical protein
MKAWAAAVGVGVGDGDGVIGVVDVDDSVAVRVDGEDQTGVVHLAGKPEAWVAAAVGSGRVQPERVVDVNAGAAGLDAGSRVFIACGEQQQPEEEEQRSHVAGVNEWRTERVLVYSSMLCVLEGQVTVLGRGRRGLGLGCGNFPQE